MPRQPKYSIEEYCLSLLDSMYDAVLIVDQNERVIYVNDSFTRVTGAEKSTLLGQILHKVRPGARMPTVLKTGVAELGIHRVVGNREHVANVVPIFRDGKQIGGASISNNTTDIMRISNELEKYRASLRKMEAMMKKVRVTRYCFDDIIAESKSSIDAKRTAMRLAQKDISVLLLGESGTGKEIYAQSIHDASTRRNSPFIAINCSALSPDLLESELFGYEDGTFTGARKGGKPGVFEAANHGTVFLDEIAEMDVAFQAKLLRTLQEGVVRRVGGDKEIRVDVRVLSATNRDLMQSVEKGEFRLDLYYRIAHISLSLEPLRNRPEDLRVMIDHFLTREGERNGKNLSLTPNARELLLNYHWPGNIRELSNALRAAAILVDRDTIDVDDFSQTIRDYGIAADYVPITSLKEAVHKAEQEVIQKALLKYGNSTEGKRRAAKALNISVATLYNKLSL